MNIDSDIEQYKKQSEMEPHNPELHHKLGDLYLQKSSMIEAIASYQKAGAEYEKNGLYLKSISLTKKIINLDKNMRILYPKLGELYIKIGLQKEGMGYVLSYVDELMEKKKKDKIIYIYESVINGLDGNLEVKYLMAKIYLAEGKREKALKWLNSAMEGYRKDGNKEKEDELAKGIRFLNLPFSEEMSPEDTAEMANLLYEIGSPDESFENYKHAITGFIQTGKHSKAKELCEKTAKLFPSDKELGELKKVIQVLLNLYPTKDVFGLLEDLKSIASLKLKDNPEKNFSMGTAFKKVGLLNDAITKFETTAKSPSSEIRFNSYREIGDCYLKKNDYPNAIDALNEALKIDGVDEMKQLPLHYNLALVLKEIENLEKAKSELKKVIEIDPNYKDAKKLTEELEKSMVSEVAPVEEILGAEEPVLKEEKLEIIGSEENISFV